MLCALHCRGVSRLVCVLAALVVGPSLLAQTDQEPASVTRTFVLQNARIVQAPDRIIERGSVLIRDGLIEAVGPDVQVPFDAAVIEADSMVVYAGFIDGLSTTGIPEPKRSDNNEDDDEIKPGDPPAERAGIQPGRDVYSLVQPDDKSVNDLRELGFTMVHVVPHGQMLPGSGALILLHGEEPAEMLFARDVSMYAQMEGARGVYPQTLMGVMAKWRTLYHEAERRKRLQALYDENPAGLTRPKYSPVHYPFFPVIDGATPVVFRAESAGDVRRAMSLYTELGFSLILANVREGWLLADELVEVGLPLFVALELPEEPETDAAKDTTATDSTAAPTAGDAMGQIVARTTSPGDLDAETRRLRERQQEWLTAYRSNAAHLHEAGLSFGFSTMDAKPTDIRDNLRLMIKEGLPEDEALAALTTHPASFLGISSSVGTIDPGKLANLVVTTGPYFEEKSEVRFVFVDGYRYEYESRPERRPSDPDAPVAQIVGTWSYSAETPNGRSSGTITISGEPDDFSGILTSDQIASDADLQDVYLDGDRLSFSSNVDAGNETLKVFFTMTVDEDIMDGTMEIDSYGTFPIEATRTGTPG